MSDYYESNSNDDYEYEDEDQYYQDEDYEDDCSDRYQNQKSRKAENKKKESELMKKLKQEFELPETEAIQDYIQRIRFDRIYEESTKYFIKMMKIECSKCHVFPRPAYKSSSLTFCGRCLIESGSEIESFQPFVLFENENLLILKCLFCQENHTLNLAERHFSCKLTQIKEKNFEFLEDELRRVKISNIVNFHEPKIYNTLISILCKGCKCLPIYPKSIFPNINNNYCFFCLKNKIFEEKDLLIKEVDSIFIDNYIEVQCEKCFKVSNIKDFSEHIKKCQINQQLFNTKILKLSEQTEEVKIVTLNRRINGLEKKIRKADVLYSYYKSESKKHDSSMVLSKLIFKMKELNFVRFVDNSLIVNVDSMNPLYPAFMKLIIQSFSKLSLKKIYINLLKTDEKYDEILKLFDFIANFQELEFLSIKINKNLKGKDFNFFLKSIKGLPLIKSLDLDLSENNIDNIHIIHLAKTISSYKYLKHFRINLNKNNFDLYRFSQFLSEISEIRKLKTFDIEIIEFTNYCWSSIKWFEIFKKFKNLDSFRIKTDLPSTICEIIIETLDFTCLNKFVFENTYKYNISSLINNPLNNLSVMSFVNSRFFKTICQKKFQSSTVLKKPLKCLEIKIDESNQLEEQTLQKIFTNDLREIGFNFKNYKLNKNEFLKYIGSLSPNNLKSINLGFSNSGLDNIVLFRLGTILNYLHQIDKVSLNLENNSFSESSIHEFFEKISKKNLITQIFLNFKFSCNIQDTHSIFDHSIYTRLTHTFIAISSNNKNNQDFVLNFYNKNYEVLCLNIVDNDYDKLYININSNNKNKINQYFNVKLINFLSFNFFKFKKSLTLNQYENNRYFDIIPFTNELKKFENLTHLEVDFICITEKRKKELFNFFKEMGKFLNLVTLRLHFQNVELDKLEFSYFVKKLGQLTLLKNLDLDLTSTKCFLESGHFRFVVPNKINIRFIDSLNKLKELETLRFYINVNEKSYRNEHVCLAKTFGKFKKIKLIETNSTYNLFENIYRWKKHEEMLLYEGLIDPYMNISELWEITKQLDKLYLRLNHDTQISDNNERLIQFSSNINPKIINFEVNLEKNPNVYESGVRFLFKILHEGMQILTLNINKIALSREVQSEFKECLIKAINISQLKLDLSETKLSLIESITYSLKKMKNLKILKLDLSNNFLNSSNKIPALIKSMGFSSISDFDLNISFNKLSEHDIFDMAKEFVNMKKLVKLKLNISNNILPIKSPELIFNNIFANNSLKYLDLDLSNNIFILQYLHYKSKKNNTLLELSINLRNTKFKSQTLSLILNKITSLEKIIKIDLDILPYKLELVEIYSFFSSLRSQKRNIQILYNFTLYERKRLKMDEFKNFIKLNQYFLTRYDLRINIELLESECFDFFKILKNNTLEKIEIFIHVVKELTFKTIHSMVKDINHIKKISKVELDFNFSGTIHKKEVIPKISRILSEIRSIDTLKLRLQNNEIDFHSLNFMKWDPLFTKMKYSNLTLDLSNNLINKHALEQLAEILRKMNHLKKLAVNFSGNSELKVSDIFARNMQDLENLESLKLDFSKIMLDKIDFILISDLFVSFSKLKKKNLRLNRFKKDDPGFYSLYNSLIYNKNKDNDVKIKIMSDLLELKEKQFLEFQNISLFAWGIGQTSDIRNKDYTNFRCSCKAKKKEIRELEENINTHLFKCFMYVKNGVIKNLIANCNDDLYYLGKIINNLDLSKMKIFNCNIKTYDKFMVGIISAKMHPEIHDLNMSFSIKNEKVNQDNKMNDTIMIGQTLQVLTNLTKLNIELRSFNIQKFDANYIADSFSQLSNLTYLRINLKFTQIDESTSKKFSDSITNMVNLNELHLALNGCYLKDQGVKNLTDCFKFLKNLNKLTLNLKSNGMQFSKIGLSENLKNLENLTFLNLDFNSNSIDETNHLEFEQLFTKSIPSLKELNTLQYDLSWVKFSKGDQIVFNPLKHLKKLVNFSSNLINSRAYYIQNELINEFRLAVNLKNFKRLEILYEDGPLTSDSKTSFHNQLNEIIFKNCKNLSYVRLFGY